MREIIIRCCRKVEGDESGGDTNIRIRGAVLAA